MHVWPKKMLRRCYVLADVIIFVYEVPCIFWRYINVDEVSWVTLKKLSQSAIESTKCDSLVYYKVRWTIITNCDTVYYKRLRQVLQSAMIITNCHSTSTTTHNLVTFNIAKYHQITRKNAAYLQINTSGLFSYTRLIQVPGCTVTRSGDQHRPCFHLEFHLEFCSRVINLTPKSLFPKSGQYRSFLSQPGSGGLIRLGKWNENTIQYWTTLGILLSLSQSQIFTWSGAPNEPVPQNICSSGQFLLAGRFGKNCISLEGMLLGNRQLRVSEGISCLQ